MKLLLRNLLFCFSFGFSYLSGLATELPMQIIKGLPYIEAKINGQGPFLFGFDTGFGGELELDSSLAEKLGIKISGKMEIGDPSGRNNIIMHTSKLQNIQFNDITIKNISALLRNRGAMPGMEKVSGIIGMVIFKNHVITIDYPQLKFIINKVYLPPANGTTILNYEPLMGGIPSIRLRIGNEVINAHIDTRGMAGNFKIPESFLSKVHFLNEPKLVGRGRTVSNEILINEVQLKETIQFGQYKYETPTVTYPSLTGDGLIGAKILKDYAITIDQKNHRIQFLKGPIKESGIPEKEPKPKNDFYEYAGQYGDRKVGTDSQGGLFIQRPGGLELKMISKGKDEFSLKIVPGAIINFERDADGKIAAVKVLNLQGGWEKSLKNK